MSDRVKEYNDIKITIKVTPTLRKKIEEASESLGVTISAILKMAVVDYLNKIEMIQDLQDRMIKKEIKTISK